MFDATGTIGGLPIEKRLGELLSESKNEKLIGTICQFLVNCRKHLKALEDIECEKSRTFFLNLLKKNNLETLENITGFLCHGVPCNDAVTSHTACCLKTYYNLFEKKTNNGL